MTKEEEYKAYKLAEEYHTECNAFDRYITGDPNGRLRSPLHIQASGLYSRYMQEKLRNKYGMDAQDAIRWFNRLYPKKL